jgi:hypothetical protein
MPHTVSNEGHRYYLIVALSPTLLSLVKDNNVSYLAVSGEGNVPYLTVSGEVHDCC